MHADPIRQRRWRLDEERLGWLLVSPAVLVMAAVAFFPIASAFWLSLHDINLKYPYLGQPFIGIENYLRITNDVRFWNALKVTSLFALVSVAVELVLGMVVALLINRPFRGRGLVRASVLVPWALTTVVMARIWAWIYDSEYGVFNALLAALD